MQASLEAVLHLVEVRPNALQIIDFFIWLIASGQICTHGRLGLARSAIGGSETLSRVCARRPAASQSVYARSFGCRLRGYALFAMLVWPDLGGIIPHEAETFTPKDAKSARKFGKSWILGAQKSHLTIRIDPQAAAHMQERRARLEFERQAQEERNGPIRHWVAEHERHYRSGKVVLVKGHHRGHAPVPNLPTRVMGPNSDAAGFEFPTTAPSNQG